MTNKGLFEIPNAWNEPTEKLSEKYNIKRISVNHLKNEESPEPLSGQKILFLNMIVIHMNNFQKRQERLEIWGQ